MIEKNCLRIFDNRLPNCLRTNLKKVSIETHFCSPQLHYYIYTHLCITETRHLKPVELRERIYIFNSYIIGSFACACTLLIREQ